jgi:hypothetical protein
MLELKKIINNITRLTKEKNKKERNNQKTEREIK